jgi:glycolate oxidase
MDLTREQYNALEDVVGPEYISEEPAIRDAYCKVWGNRIIYDDDYAVRPAAVVLPGSTEDVQRIVKVCNRYKIVFKPSATLFATGAQPSSENAIALDLRRMNRILEIDEKNKHMVVEPYVSHLKAQIAAMERGLYLGAIGAGPSASVVATHCCFGGDCLTSPGTAANGRNVLGAEWVLPTGDILRLGTAGTGAGWFSADGPGPSLQGIMRGQRGASGSLGVVTKVAVKLYDWCGTKMWNFVGDAANYHIDGKLEGYEIYTITFPTKNDMFEAVYLLHEEQIALSLMRANPAAHILAVPEGNDEAWELWQKSVGEAGADRILHSIIMCVNARSPRQKEFNEKVIKKIIQKMHGELTPELNSPAMQEKNLANTLLATGGVRAAFRVVGCFSGAAHGSDSLDLCKRLEEIGIELEKPYIERGDFLQVWEYGQMASEHNTVGGRGGIYIQYDPWDPTSLEAARKIARESPKPEPENYALPLPGEMPERPAAMMGGRTGENVGDWAAHIKWMFDPNNVSDGDNYPLPKPPIKPNDRGSGL